MTYQSSTTLLLVAFACQIAAADITYNLVDHGVPDHTLTGTITVLDTAADDGILTEAEVSSWAVAVSGTLINFSIDSDSGSPNLVITDNVSITSEMITIEAADMGESNRIAYGNMGAEYQDRNSGGGDVSYQQPVSLALLPVPNTARVHAVAQVIPEPSSLSLIVATSLGALCRRR